jgi:hypothetical protein
MKGGLDFIFHPFSVLTKGSTLPAIGVEALVIDADTTTRGEGHVAELLTLLAY